MNRAFVYTAMIVFLWSCGGDEPSVPTLRAIKNVAFSIHASDVIENTDVDAQIRWSILRSPVGADARLRDQAGEQIIFETPISGKYELALSFGKGQNVATYPFAIEVENTAPTVVAQSDEFVPVGLPLLLRVEDSADLNGDVLSFQWHVTDAPEGSVLVGNMLSGTFISDIEGRFTIRLDAVDSEGAIGSSSFIVAATRNFNPVELPIDGRPRSLGFVNGTLLYMSEDGIAVKVGQAAMREILLPKTVGTLNRVRLSKNGAFAALSTYTGSINDRQNFIHVIDIALGQVTKTFSVEDLANPIAFASEDELYYASQLSKIWSIDLNTGEATQLLQASYSGLVFDESQPAFYTESFRRIRKWVFEQGVLVEAHSVELDDTIESLHLAAGRQELIDLYNGKIYRVSPDINEDLVLIGAFPGRIQSILNPESQNWRVTTENVGGETYPRPIEYGASTNQPSPLVISPLYYDGRLEKIARIYGITEGLNPNEVYMVFDAGQKLMLGVFPVHAN